MHFQILDYCLCCGYPIIVATHRHHLAVGCYRTFYFKEYFISLDLTKQLHSRYFQSCSVNTQCASHKKSEITPKVICPLTFPSVLEQRTTFITVIRQLIRQLVEQYGKCHVHNFNHVFIEHEIHQIADELHIPFNQKHGLQYFTNLPFWTKLMIRWKCYLQLLTFFFSLMSIQIFFDDALLSLAISAVVIIIMRVFMTFRTKSQLTRINDLGSSFLKIE